MDLPQTFTKGDQTRVANTAARAVELKFDGYLPAGELTADDVDYRALQAQAKEVGIPANQGKEALLEALAVQDPA